MDLFGGFWWFCLWGGMGVVFWGAGCLVLVLELMFWMWICGFTFAGFGG